MTLQDLLELTKVSSTSKITKPAMPTLSGMILSRQNLVLLLPLLLGPALTFFGCLYLSRYPAVVAPFILLMSALVFVSTLMLTVSWLK